MMGVVGEVVGRWGWLELKGEDGGEKTNPR